MNRESLSRLGWDDRLERAYRRYDRPDRRPARVGGVDLGVCTLLGSGGACRVSLGGEVLAAAVRDTTRLPCPGDWVVVRTWPDARLTIEAVLPRRTTTPGDDFYIEFHDIDGSSSAGGVGPLSDMRKCPTGHPPADRSVGPG